MATSPWRTRRRRDAAGLPRHLASMRPWRLRHGEPAASRRRPTPKEQGFNAAMATSPWRTEQQRAAAVACQRLQCGHGDFAMENESPAGDHRRLAHRFNAAMATSPWRTETEEAVMAKGGGLQCGHGDFAME